MNSKTFFVIMGVSGSGKSTFGRIIAKRLNCPFYDADDFHPPENVAKMAAGNPLNDDDRIPWLNRLHQLIQQHLEVGETAVLACSALKESYRQRLMGRLEGIKFIYLDGRFDLIWRRMASRPDHFMKSEMLQSQFDTLEPPTPTEALVVPIDASIEEVADTIMTLIAPEAL